MAATKTPPIIIIKRKSGHGAHHGGAWKVAYADFVTAMMSLFIVLWLMNSSEKIKKAVAGYFNDPKGTSTLMGTTVSGTGEAISPAAANNMQQLKDKLEAGIKARKDLDKLSKQIEITITPEGLRIELLEGKNGTFYQSGSPRLSESGQDLLALLGGELKTLPNALLIEGHTDATPYSADTSYSNWELSADRANAARRLLQQDGVRSNQVTQVRGYADQLLRVKNNPTDPSNRRVSILVKNDHGVAPNLPSGKGTNGGAAAEKTAAGDNNPRKVPRAEGNGAISAATSPVTEKTGQVATSLPTVVVPPKSASATSVSTPGLMARVKRMITGNKSK